MLFHEMPLTDRSSDEAFDWLSANTIGDSLRKKLLREVGRFQYGHENLRREMSDRMMLPDYHPVTDPSSLSAQTGWTVTFIKSSTLSAPGDIAQGDFGTWLIHPMKAESDLGFGRPSETENATDIDPSLTGPETVPTIVDAREKLWRITKLKDAIDFARHSISVGLAERLTGLQGLPYRREAGEKSLSLKSVLWFLDYCLRRGKIKQPLMSLTPDGMLQGDWQADKTRRLTLRFFPDGRVWAAIRDGSVHGAWEMPASLLLSEESLVRIPDWA